MKVNTTLSLILSLSITIPVVAQSDLARWNAKVERRISDGMEIFHRDFPAEMGRSPTSEEEADFRRSLFEMSWYNTNSGSVEGAVKRFCSRIRQRAYRTKIRQDDLARSDVYHKLMTRQGASTDDELKEFARRRAEEDISAGEYVEEVIDTRNRKLVQFVLEWYFLAAVPVLSGIAFVMFYSDKRIAEENGRREERRIATYWEPIKRGSDPTDDPLHPRNDQRRLPEASLLTISLFGGWPGSVASMYAFRHKTRKRAFLIPFWICSGLHVVMFAAAIAWSAV